MKKAIGYVRISTEDQSNFSIEGQEKLIQEFCIKQNFQLVEVFKDEGQSAKNFDRYDWKNLELFISKNYKQIDLLIVYKYDRFSRNLLEALSTIERLEKKFSITIMSVNENIGLHTKSPYYFQMRTQFLLGAELELRIIKERTLFGNYTAKKAGRWINRAPLGYINSRDENKKPIIVIDEDKSKIVQFIFNQYCNGVTVEAIRKEIKEKFFFTIKGNSTIQDVLTNEVYAGIIKVPAYYDEPEQLVKGIHKPIILEEVFWQAQNILNQKKGRLHLTLNDDFPLKGALHCHCNRLLTASFVKSGSGKYMGYYNCNTHRNPNLNAIKLHDQFLAILQELNFKKESITSLVEITKKKFDERISEQKKSIAKFEHKYEELEKTINSLEEKYISDKMDFETYKKWKSKIALDFAEVKSKLSDLKQPLQTIIEKFNNQIYMLTDLKELYKMASTSQKQSFINLVFDNSLYYQNNTYRTKTINALFEHKALILKQKNLLLIEKVSQNSLILENVPISGTLSNFNELFNLISQIKKSA